MHHNIEYQESMEDELRKLKIQLKQTMDMYHVAYKKALASKHKVFMSITNEIIDKCMHLESSYNLISGY